MNISCKALVTMNGTTDYLDVTALKTTAGEDGQIMGNNNNGSCRFLAYKISD
jgi:hypothetical protein